MNLAAAAAMILGTLLIVLAANSCLITLTQGHVGRHVNYEIAKSLGGSAPKTCWDCEYEKGLRTGIAGPCTSG
jgi:hypothetical protein